VTPDRVKVVTVMPCYDKKLEAVRPNFSLGQAQPDVKEVDTVLATHEFVELINGLAEKEGKAPSLENFSLIPYYYGQRT
jgi:iron only hydrogenase large subunit-like protein